MSYFVGIDPGQLGGVAALDERGRFVAAHRWQAPALLFDFLAIISPEIKAVYLERIQPHPGEGVGHVTNNYALAVNFGLWQGLLVALALAPVLVHPATWQAAHGLTHWQAKQAKHPAAPGPLQMARSLFP